MKHRIEYQHIWMLYSYLQTTTGFYERQLQFYTTPKYATLNSAHRNKKEIRIC